MKKKSNKVIRNLLTILREFDVLHKKNLKGNMAFVDLHKQKIYIKTYGPGEDVNSIYHELRHVFQYYQRFKPEETLEEQDAEEGSAAWVRNSYENLEELT